MTMIFDFEPWQLDIDIDLTKQLYRSCKGDIFNDYEQGCFRKNKQDKSQ